MERNLDRRIEILTEILQSDHIQELDHILEFSMSSEISHWRLRSDDTWEHVHQKNNQDLMDYQEALIARFSQ